MIPCPALRTLLTQCSQHFSFKDIIFLLAETLSNESHFSIFIYSFTQHPISIAGAPAICHPQMEATEFKDESVKVPDTKCSEPHGVD